MTAPRYDADGTLFTRANDTDGDDSVYALSGDHWRRVLRFLPKHHSSAVDEDPDENAASAVDIDKEGNLTAEFERGNVTHTVHFTRDGKILSKRATHHLYYTDDTDGKIDVPRGSTSAAATTTATSTKSPSLIPQTTSRSISKTITAPASRIGAKGSRADRGRS